MDQPTRRLEPALHRLVDGSVEWAMLEALAGRFGGDIRPRMIGLGNGTRTEVDGADEDGSVLAQLVTNTGTFKSAHRNKVAADMFKLAWLRTSVLPGATAVLCVSLTAAQAFTRAGWSTLAARDAGIDVLVFGAGGGLAPLFADGGAS